MDQIRFDPAISLGSIVQIVVFIFTVVVAYSRFVDRLSKIETKLNIMWTAFERRLASRRQDQDFFGDHYR